MPLAFLDWRRHHHEAVGPIRDRVIPTGAHGGPSRTVSRHILIPDLGEQLWGCFRLVDARRRDGLRQPAAASQGRHGRPMISPSARSHWVSRPRMPRRPDA
jgi:hypothetical protein